MKIAAVFFFLTEFRNGIFTPKQGEYMPKNISCFQLKNLIQYQ